MTNGKNKVKNEKMFDKIMKDNDFLKTEVEILEKVLKYLFKKYGFSDECLVKWSAQLKSGDSVFRADAVILDENGKPLVVIEVKKSIETSLSIEYFKNLFKNTDCLFGVLTDGNKYIYFENDKKNKTANQIPELPNIKQILKEPGFELKPHQKEALIKIKKAIKSKKKRILLSMPNGTGKTILTFYLANELLFKKVIKRALFIAPYNEIVETMKKYSKSIFPNLLTEILYSDTQLKKNIFYFSNLKTLSDWYNRNMNSPVFDLIIFDNCDIRIKQDELIEELSPLLDKSIIIGLTVRSGEEVSLDILRFFGKPVFEYSLRYAIQDSNIEPKKFTKDNLTPLKDTSDILWKIMDLLRGQLTISESVTEITKILLCKIYDERWNKEELEFQKLRNEIAHRKNHHISDRLNQLMDKINHKYKLDIETRIKLGDDSLSKIIMLLQGIALTDKEGNLLDKTIEEKLYSKISESRKSEKHYVPLDLKRLLIRLVDLKKEDKIADINCGAGDLILEISKQIEPNNIYGFDKLRENIAITQLRLLLNGRNLYNLRNQGLDSLSNYSNSFDKILTIPSFGMKIQTDNNEYSSSELITINRGLSLLKEGGTLYIVVPEGVLFRKERQFINLREEILKEYHIKAIISLPTAAFFPYTTVKTNILIVEKVRPNSDSFVKMKQLDSIEALNHFDGDNFNNLPENIVFKTNIIETDSFSIKQEIMNKDNFTVSFYNPSFAKEKNKLLENMRTILLKECAEVIKGVSIKSSDYLKQGLRVIQIRDLERGKLSEDNPKFVDESKYFEKQRQSIQKDDILLATTGTIGKVAIIKENNQNGLVSSTLTIIRPKIDPLYLFYILQSEFVNIQLNRITRGDYIKNVTLEDLKNIEIPYPELIMKRELSHKMERLEQDLKEAEENKKKVEKEIEDLKKDMHKMVFR